MGLKNYSVLKGRPINNRLATGSSPHYQVLVSADGVQYRIAVNVRSQTAARSNSWCARVSSIRSPTG